VTVELRVLTPADAAEHCAGEDELTVRWLTGGYGDVDRTVEYFTWLAANAVAGTGKRGFGVWTDGRLCGYVDYDPDSTDGIGVQDVSLASGICGTFDPRPTPRPTGAPRR
jgi:hypothetical protein